MIPDEWDALRSLTTARVALGRAGSSTPTRARLEFALDHARARDAVNEAFVADAVAAALTSVDGPPVVAVPSAAADRDEYLLRPERGARLADAARAEIAGLDAPPSDLVIVLADGLSAGATNDEGATVARTIASSMAGRGWAVGPFVVVTNGRVAIGDEIGELLRAAFVVVLIGERPGLSANRSLGAYITRAPRLGRTDAERNCVSNIHPGGTSPTDAAARIVDVLTRARAAGATGVTLDAASATATGRISPT